MLPREIRDSNGELVAYNSNPGCTYGEVLGVKIDKRMDRIESNVGDMRIDMQKISRDVDNIKSQVAGICGLTRELTNEVRTYAKIQTEAQHEKRICILEKQITVAERLAKISIAVIGLFGTVAGTVYSFFKISGGK